MSQIDFLLLSVTSLCLFFTVAASIRIARSTPTTLIRKFHVCERELAEFSAEHERLKLAWQTYRAEMQAFVEEANNVLASVEKKRRQIAASESRMGRRNGEAAGEISQDENPQRALIQRARAAGIDI